MPKKVTKKKAKQFLLLSGALLLSSLVKVYVDTNIFKVNNIRFRTKKLPHDTNFSILQITDLHNRVFGKQNEILIKTVKDIHADVVVLTGDLISRGTNDFTNVFTLVEEIIKVNPNVYYVTGNHELGNDNVDMFLAGLEERGVNILRNQNTKITRGDTVINLVGIDNESTNHEDLDQAFDSISEEHYTVLLSHSPNVVDKYDSIPADLILSGHTHGGQIRLPLIGAVVGPDRSFFPKLDKGIFEIHTGQYLYVDSGIGTSGYPVRFLNQSQISLIEVRGEG
ncbi:metallophosphoesterase [Ornithinibacillus californiensis]|uniref:metallophosphoesterase n=1 Tax=Ornithinibacillus californiensis TaxID=161536 RepID=UPI00064D8162|nr:metallophosphoesterase [Ornithinibacillus californiensis]